MQRKNRDGFQVNQQEYGRFRDLRNASLREAEAILDGPDLNNAFRDMIHSDMLRINTDDPSAKRRDYNKQISVLQLMYKVFLYITFACINLYLMY